MVNNNMTVGIFVSVALALVVGMTIWLTGKRGTEPTVDYSILFEDDVSGLMLGGPVFYLGVEVGEVTEMVIVKGDPVRIRVDIELLASAPIDSGTYASLALQGITGISIIKLASDPGQHGPLQKTPGFDYPLIEQRESGFSALLDSAPDILAKMNSLLDSANTLLADSNLQAVSQSLNSIESLLSSVAAQDEAIASLPQALNDTLVEVGSTMAELQSVINEAQPGIVSSLDNLSRATARLAGITGNIETWVVANDGDMHNFLSKGLGQVPELISDARNALRDIEKLLQDIREDPSGILYKTEESGVTTEH